jgi:hemerythrin
MESDKDIGGVVWKEEFSVHVAVIDNQHKEFLNILNRMIKLIHEAPKDDEVQKIITELLAYKAIHFATEEKYFAEFNYDGKEEHEKAHRTFDVKIREIQDAHAGDVLGGAFALVDFLEDWFIGHLSNLDQKYVQCFHEHGLT